MNNKKLIAQYNRVIRGKQINYEEGVHKYIDE